MHRGKLQNTQQVETDYTLEFILFSVERHLFGGASVFVYANYARNGSRIFTG